MSPRSRRRASRSPLRRRTTSASRSSPQAAPGTVSCRLKGEFANQTLVDVSAQPPTGITVTSQETDNLCIEALAAGRSWDFFVQGKEFIQNAIDKGAKIKFLDNKWITAEQISIALDKAGLPTASMLAALNKIVADAHADGTLTAISKKWLNGVDVTVKQ